MMGLGWLLEFALESAGAILYSRRNKLLSFILGFCAVTDFAAAALKGHYSGNTIYGLCAWSQFALKELFLVWLACAICGIFVAEQDRFRAYLAAAFVSLATCSLVTAFAFQSEALKDRLLNGEIAATMVLLATIWLGWVGRKTVLSPEWKVILLGFVTMVGGDFLVTLAWMKWDGAQKWQAIPTIAAQLIWICGPLRRVRLSEFRRSLEKKFPAVEEMRVM